MFEWNGRDGRKLPQTDWRTIVFSYRVLKSIIPATLTSTTGTIIINDFLVPLHLFLFLLLSIDVLEGFVDFSLLLNKFEIVKMTVPSIVRLED